jgi:branched-chain amino acid transport system permease protein
VPGIVLGAIYAVGAIGITLVFGILRFAHFAHGDMATLGAFVALALVTAGHHPVERRCRSRWRRSRWWRSCVDKLFYDYLKARPKIMTVMASLGVALMLRAVVQVVFGVDPRTYASGIVRPGRLLRHPAARPRAVHAGRGGG